MSTKRLRIFAGPNGSGKTTIFRELLKNNKINLGIYVNADDIELRLEKEACLDLSEFSITTEIAVIRQYFRESNFSPVKRNEPDLWTKLELKDNVLFVNTRIDSYLAADLAEWLRQQLLSQGLSFTFETVMSHPGKIEFMKNAQERGYRVYLYFIATEDPEINISRVNVRVALNGHPVPPNVVKQRYYKSMSLLRDAVKQTNRAYIWDNSGSQAKFIAEVTDGHFVRTNEIIHTPAWVDEFLFSKS
jgi:predicted ABC-type ATPase